MTENLEKFELGIALQKIYDFLWDEFCDWYIELSKYRIYHADEEPKQANAALWTLREVLKNALKLLHPYMPFLSEEIYTSLIPEEESLMISSWPVKSDKWIFPEEERVVSHLQDMVRGVRNRRMEMEVPASRKATVHVVTQDEALAKGLAAFRESAKPLASASEILIEASADGIASDAVSLVIPDAVVFLPLSELIDIEQEKERLQREKERLESEIKRAKGMLSNEKFVSRAPKDKVEAEQEKLKKYQGMYEETLRRIEALFN